VVPAPRRRRIEPSGLEIRSRKLPIYPDGEQVFRSLFGEEPLAFWLDSSRVEGGLSRFSFMGAGTGPLSALVRYSAASQQVTVTESGAERRTRESIYTYLERELDRRRCSSGDLPFDFNCGFVGYFGYELEVEGGARHEHASPHPDAMFIFADRMIVLDHQERELYLICLAQAGAQGSVDAWLDAMERRLIEAPAPAARAPVLHDRPITFRLGRTHRTYLADVERCKRHILDGETYEVCLTNQVHTTVDDAFEVYSTLRRLNPAPYAAFLRFEALAIASSSPERFLRIDREGNVESKPIKGTRPRGRSPEEDEALRRDLATSEKDRAENLMIVDLLRNDLGRVCEVGSVHVPLLMDVETYPTVHHLVSTIRGCLRPGLGAIDCVRSAFPGGSMTGAPKLRTMRILDALEVEPRGVYSGAIGYLGLNGTADLSIVIRTLVRSPGATTIGVGGAIVALSDPEVEFEETMVKAKALIHAVVTTARGGVDPEAYERAMRQLRETGLGTF
jgi:para-aminobenzoate synthetase